MDIKTLQIYIKWNSNLNMINIIFVRDILIFGILVVFIIN